MISLFKKSRASSLALAMALATGTAVVATAVIPAEASAQRNRDRDRDRDSSSEDNGGGYSDEFRAIYVPLDEALKAEGADVASLRGQIDALAGTLNTNDEKIAGGGLMYNAGISTSDPTLQLRGMEFMLASGKIPIDQTGRYNFIAYQLANGQNDYAKARTYLQGAIQYNFTTADISSDDLRITMAESYFTTEEYQAGFDYLRQIISDRKARNQPVAENWYRRGVAVSYQNEISPEVYDFATMWVSDYPTAENWREAINVTRNLNSFERTEILDLFRLSRRVDALQDESDYDYYVEAADARRLPKEVRDIIGEGRASGVISADNLFIAESLEIADGRIASDRADLPALERDAMAADAGLRTVVAAGGAFLSYGEFAKAATFYQRALGMPGVDTAEALTRLGIAQLSMGDYDAARTTFGQIQGSRMPIAKLWIAHANQLEAAAAPAPAPLPM
ncbi:MAG: hypothetical protein ABJN35_03325 [Erythrobacter sp.]